MRAGAGWWLWLFGAGVPLGALAGRCVAEDEPIAVLLGALLAGLASVAVVAAVVRGRADAALRARLATAAGAGWVALPALALAWLRIPAPAVLAAATAASAAVFAAAIACGALGSWRGGGALRALAVVVAALALGAATAVAAAGVVSARSGFALSVASPAVPPIDDPLVGLPGLPRVECAAEPAGVAVLRDGGARPRASADGRYVWFDAAVDGVRQVHRLDLAERRTTCWTCGEPGHNWRPEPAADGAAVVFETDRHASWWHPSNTEIHILDAQGDARRLPSRRLTFTPGEDDHAVLSPDARSLIWSRRAGAGYELVRAALVAGQGEWRLADVSALAGGGARWIAPVAWSPDGRTLVVASGNPFRPRTAHIVDLATGWRALVAPDLASGAAAAFDADGEWWVLTAAVGDGRLARALPDESGFLSGWLASRVERAGPLFRDTEIRVGATLGGRSPLALGPLAQWGEPTGIALVSGPAAAGETDVTLVLAQRRAGTAGARERLVEIRLACAPPSGD